MGPETDSMDLKVRELLKEVQLDQSTIKALDEVVSSIADAIRSVPERKIGPEAVPGFIKDVGAGAPSSKIEFTFRTPKFVTVVGSHSILAVTKPDINVDVLVRMPKECFYEKDYLNHRYHARRCLYLYVIKEHLELSTLVRKIEWSTFQNEARKPVLLVFPDVKDAELSRFFIRVIPTATSLFGVSRLSLSRNNVRAVCEGSIAQATPKYNCSILEDMFLEENAEFVKESFHGWKDLEEALILLKVWARQRSSIYSHDCLNGFLLSVIMSYLASRLGGDHINKEMNTLQIFRVTLNFIATSILWDRGLFLQPHALCNMSDEEKSHHLQLFPVVLCDVSGHVNLAFRFTREAFKELRDEAAWTLQCIEKHGDRGFEEIFMTRVDHPAKFDFYTRISLKENSKVRASGFCLDDECWKMCEQEVHSLLERALSDRAKLVRVTWKSTPHEWDIKDGFSKFLHGPMHVGILVNSYEKSFRMVDVGPNAENKAEAANFRKFWGEKAELRRFKDGTIAESTVWKCNQWERHLIIKRITEFVLCKHLLLSAEDVVHVTDQLDFCLCHGTRDPISFSGDLLASFEVLSKRLRLLEDIPLKVSSVQPLDPAFRYTSVFPPEPHPLAYEKGVDLKRLKLAPTCIQPLEVMIQLEGSGNWPLDEVAMERTKSAFLLKIGESLQDRWGMFCTATEKEVDVLTSGYAFRLRILHERGLSLLNNPGSTGNINTKGISALDKELFLRGQHSSMINGLNGRYPAYGPVVRLAKRWISSHLFSSFLSEEATELLVAYIFLNPFPFHSPCSRVTGFLRFLRLLASYDWIFSPLIVDINCDLSLKDKQEINVNFNLSRKSYEKDPQNVEPAMFLATSYDKFSVAWTKISPKMPVLKRLVSYAQSSAELLTNLILQGQNGTYTWECLFRTPLNNHDAIVLLHPDKLSYPGRLLFPSEMKQGKHVIRGSSCKDFNPFMSLGSALEGLEEARNRLMVNFDPTKCFVEDLKGGFPNMFKVWYDSLGGDAVGLTWEKQGTRKRSREEAEELQREALDVLKNVGEAGKGFVRSIYFLKAPRLHS